MKSLPVGEFKAQLSQLVEEVQNGATIKLVKGKKRVPVALLVPIDRSKSNKKRKFGILKGKASVTFADDFKMTEEEFINLR